MKSKDGKKTAIGLTENMASLLCYVAGWVSGLAFYLIEKENRFIRFHAVQSIITFGTITIFILTLGWLPVVGAVLRWALLGVSLIIRVFMML